MQEIWVRSLGQEDPLEEEMATHSSILTWRIPWTEEPGGLQPIGSQRVGHDWMSEQAEMICHLCIHLLFTLYTQQDSIFYWLLNIFSASDFILTNLFFNW